MGNKEQLEETLGARMKDYEGVAQYRLSRKLPVICRIDGKAFHTLTASCQKPHDPTMAACMRAVAQGLCENLQGARFAYGQSDEVSLLLVDYDDIRSEGWFGYNLQKMASVSASYATAFFERTWWAEPLRPPRPKSPAVFDGRFFSLPPSEVTNYFIWRQQDAVRNSVAGLAQAHFSAKQLHGKNGPAMHEMLHEVGVNWADLPTSQKHGWCVTRETYEIEAISGDMALRHRWVVDEEIPKFTADREYVEKFVRPREVEA